MIKIKITWSKILKYLKENNDDPDKWEPEIDNWDEVRQHIQEMNRASLEKEPELLKERAKKDAWVSKMLGTREWIEKSKKRSEK